MYITHSDTTLWTPWETQCVITTVLPGNEFGTQSEYILTTGMLKTLFALFSISSFNILWYNCGTQKIQCTSDENSIYLMKKWI